MSMMRTALLVTAWLISLFSLCLSAKLNVFGHEYIIERVLSESKPLEDHVKKRGYPFEKHIITSADGYILTYHRVPHSTPDVESLRGDKKPHRHPILLVHGILQSSAFFLAIKDGLAYKFADAGFDVWLANHRGNPYSKAHLHMNPRRQKNYWKFSFDEMGRYDLPVAVDYILKTTGRPTLTYVGFSMGTTMFWVYGHVWPDDMLKIDYMIAIAPIARPSGLKMVMERSTYGVVTKILEAMDVLHFFEFRPYRRKEAFFVRIPCKDSNTKKQNGLCRFILKVVCSFSGMQENLLDYQATLESLEFMSAGTSIKSLYHLLQVGSAGTFQMYDYGDKLNMRYYGGRTYPPSYDLSRVTCPVYLIQGGKDEFSVSKDTEWLVQQFPQAKFFFQEESEEFNHLDFFFANEVNKILYRPLVDELERIADINEVHLKLYAPEKDQKAVLISVAP